MLTGSMLYVSFSMSAKYTSPPKCRALVAVETNVYGVVMTAFPGFTPHASIARSMPLVLLFTASAYGTPIFAANSFSKASASLPVVSQPLRITLITASSSSFVNDGLKNGTFSESQSAIRAPPLRKLPCQSAGLQLPLLYRTRRATELPCAVLPPARLCCDSVCLMKSRQLSKQQCRLSKQQCRLPKQPRHLLKQPRHLLKQPRHLLNK